MRHRGLRPRQKHCRWLRARALEGTLMQFHDSPSLTPAGLTARRADAWESTRPKRPRDLRIRRQGGRPHQATDGKQRVIAAPLRRDVLAQLARPSGSFRDPSRDPPGGKNVKTKLKSPLESTKVCKTKVKTKLNGTSRGPGS
jgi:hypothetical protein